MRCRATSVGVACYVLADCVVAGDAPGRHEKHRVYVDAGRCGVDVEEVDRCLEVLREALCTLFEDIEPLESSDEERGAWERESEASGAFSIAGEGEERG